MNVARFFAVSLSALLLAGCAGSVESFDETVGSLEQSGFPAPTDYAIHGIDVSKYQGLVDWNRVKESGVRFAWIKASEGGDRADERFAENWANSRAAGVRHGAYHFVYWCRPWQEEMAFFESIAPVEDDALPPVLDVEATPTSRTCKKHLQRDETIAEIRRMLEEMEQHFGKRPVIYTTVDFYGAILQGALEDYPIWVRSTKYFPSVKYGSRRWHFWQYQSDGHVDGIRGHVDRNAFFGSPKQWQDFVSGRSLMTMAQD